MSDEHEYQKHRASLRTQGAADAPDEAMREIAARDAEIARLRADNAALRDTIGAWIVEHGPAPALAAVLTADHPGAPLLAELARLRATIARAAEYLPSRPDVAERVLSEAQP